jgi:predicted Zn-dependent peptidase
MSTGLPGITLALVASLAGATATSAPPAAPPAAPPPTTTATATTATTTTVAPQVPPIPFARFALKNGLDVLVVEDHRVPLVAVDLWVHVGSGDEQPGRSGFAHLFEHMMFQSAEHIGEDVHFDVLRKLGATSVNGTTNSDRTNYYEVVPAHQLETALWLESDRLGFLLPMLTDKSLANQRDVVRNERRQRYDNVPWGRERFATNAALYPEGHPYRYLTIGRHEDIEGASITDVRDFWLQRYAPANATLALVGDVTVERARELVQKWFGDLRTAARPPTTKLAPTTLPRDVRVDVADPFARLQRVRWAWHSPPAFADDDLDLGILADVLGAPGWGRLQRALVIDNPIAQSVSVAQGGQQLAGTFQIAVTLKPGTTVDDVEKVLAAELHRISAEGPGAVEVARSVVNGEASLLWDLEGLLSRAERLQTFLHYVGDPGYTGTYLARLRARTTTTVQAAARRWLQQPRAVIITSPAPAASPPTTTTAPAPMPIPMPTPPSVPTPTPTLPAASTKPAATTTPAAPRGGAR